MLISVSQQMASESMEEDIYVFSVPTFCQKFEVWCNNGFN